MRLTAAKGAQTMGNLMRPMPILQNNRGREGASIAKAIIHLIPTPEERRLRHCIREWAKNAITGTVRLKK